MLGPLLNKYQIQCYLIEMYSTYTDSTIHIFFYNLTLPVSYINISYTLSYVGRHVYPHSSVYERTLWHDINRERMSWKCAFAQYKYLQIALWKSLRFCCRYFRRLLAAIVAFMDAIIDAAVVIITYIACRCCERCDIN